MPWSPVYLSPGVLDRKPGDGIVYSLVLGRLKTRDANSQTTLFTSALDTIISPAALNRSQLKSTPEVKDEAIMNTNENSQRMLLTSALVTIISPAALYSPQLTRTPEVTDEAIMTTNDLDDTFYGVDERE